MSSTVGKMTALKSKLTGYWGERIISQVEYAARLSEASNGKHDVLIGDAVDFLAARYGEDGVITKESAKKAENMLLALSKEAKGYKLICAAHAHIDMNWMWRFDETVAVTLDTFRTMLDMMKEYPDFKFSQSQASVYRIVEEYDPGMLDEIRQRIKEGRWEVTASTWVETDKNMPSGESLARHILYTKKYLSGLLGVNPESLNIDFEPDTFGHSRNVPEILANGGVKYYYHCRGFEGHNLYKWVSPSDQSVTVYRDVFWYNGTVDPSFAMYVPEFCNKHGISAMLRLYGVGDHGGGPTRRDMERIMDMSSWPVFPDIRFGTMKEFFALTEKISGSLPVVKDELNFIFTGCYTTQTRIKLANRMAESKLNEAETFGSLHSLVTGSGYCGEQFAKAWEKVLFNHFHDIIPGSGTIDTREYAMGQFQQTMAAANTQESIALRGISSKINTSELACNCEDSKLTVSEGAGVGYGISSFRVNQTERGRGITRVFHFFNPSACERNEAAEVIIWDWDGDRERLVFRDDRGEETGHQIIDNNVVRYWRDEYWGHKYITALVKVKVPPFGYSTYVMTERDIDRMRASFVKDPRVEKPDSFVMENEYVKVTFDTRNLSIISLIDRSSGEELIGAERPSGLFRLIEEDDRKGMTAWVVGRYMSIRNLDENVRVLKSHCDKTAIRQSICYEVEFNSSKLNVTASLYYDSPRIDFSVECDWHEKGKQGRSIPQLGFYMPVGYSINDYRYDIPFGTIERKAMDMDVPANSWMLGIRGGLYGKSVMLVTDSKYGFRGVDDSLSITLIRSSFDPDPYPESGIHRINFAVCLVDNLADRELIKSAHNYNHPIIGISGSIHGGELPPVKSFLSVEEGNIAISAVKMPENCSANNRLVIRVYETDGTGTQAVLKFFKKVSKACFVDINEKAVSTDNIDISIDDDRVRFDVLPYSIAGICVEF